MSYCMIIINQQSTQWVDQRFALHTKHLSARQTISEGDVALCFSFCFLSQLEVRFGFCRRPWHNSIFFPDFRTHLWLLMIRLISISFFFYIAFTD